MASLTERMLGAARLDAATYEEVEADATATPQAMLALGEEALCEQIRTIGLYRTKARHLIETCRLLVERHGGEVPREREALQALPGVGRKTANVLLNVAFGEPTMAVDTHVFRVANRTGLAQGHTADAVEQALRKHDRHVEAERSGRRPSPGLEHLDALPHGLRDARPLSAR